MNTSIKEIQETFYRQAKTCLKSSLLYHDMLKIFGNKEEVVNFIYEIISRRSMTGVIEAILTFLAFFHFNTLKNTDEFLELKKFYKTQGGNYQAADYDILENILQELWQSNSPPGPLSSGFKAGKDGEKEQSPIEAWMLETKLQTNEIARCCAVYPAVLSLGLKKINLIELGCSAGLMLLMDLYSYEYYNDEKVFVINQHEPLLRCRTPVPSKIQSLFAKEIEIVKKIGLDLFPVDLNNDDNVFMLKATLWDDVLRCERLEQAIELFRNSPLNPLSLGKERGLEEKVFPMLFPLDYTHDLIKPLELLIDTNSDLVFYCSVSTYQIPLESYHQLITRLAELAEYFHKTVYFIEFEELKKDQFKNVTAEEPFHLTIHTFPERRSSEFGRAHFHGNSLTIF